MSAARAMQFTRPRSVKGRSRSGEFVDTLKNLLAEAVTTERWGLAHRLLHQLELLASGQTETEWRAKTIKDSEPAEVAAFRSRDGEQPHEFIALLELTK